MTDNPRQHKDSDGFGPAAASPFDQPTERFPTSDDDLGLMPTEQIPSYGGGDHPDPAPPHPTEELRTADSYDRELAAALAAPVAAPEAVPPAAAQRTPRGTLDLGLLVLRVAVGAVALAHGLQKLFGIWGGPGLDGFEAFLVESGFEQARWLALAGAIGEVAAGALLILGLFTPLAAAGLLAVLINAWCVTQAAEPGLQWFAPDGPELELLLTAMLVAIVLTGPGRISVDGRRKWATRPHVGSFVVLLLGVAGGVCLWIFLNGANPLS
ncbi:DoxX family protein [Rhodococcus sp. NPDC058505]|uniref:DoxX family protein n=1 Tax=unclassified Rhodococcus (in: high G+C Gram-positive bacteria) TaxID=192944 RepID=UPI0036675151